MRKNAKPKSGMARLFSLAATKKPLIVCAGILSALSSLVSFVPYIAIYLIIREMLSALPDLSALDGAGMVGYGWLAFAGVVGNILLYFAALSCSHLAAFGTLYELKVNFATHLAKVPLGFHVMIGSGKLRKITDENIEKIEGFIAHQLPDLIAAFVAPIAMIAILLAVDWRFGLAAMAGIIVALIVQLSVYGNQGSRKMMKQYQDALEEMNNASVEYVRGISVVKAFKQTVYSFRSLHDTIKAYTTMVIPFTLSWENSFSAFVTLVNHIYLFVVPTGILIGMNSTDYAQFAATFIFYLVFVQSVSSILMKVMYINGNAMKIIGGVEGMDEILAEPELTRPQNPKAPTGYDVEFSEVVFSYDKEKQSKALSGVSFRAKQGEITAVVGPSGGGKSTIAHLIPRFFDVSEGCIRIGGVDIRDMDTHELMDQVSFVFQDVFLFKQSVMDNIRMGNQKASDQQVIEAAKAAQCHEFIMSMPEGYHTVIGTKGVHLSGGERQRIAIARAMVKDSPIVVLDEATAFADPENEHLIQQAFQVLMRHKTVVMIAHRLSTVRGADNIVVVDGGRIVEQGTHEQLIHQEGRYSAMWNTYMDTASWTMSIKKEAIKEEVHAHA